MILKLQIYKFFFNLNYFFVILPVISTEVKRNGDPSEVKAFTFDE